MSCKYVYLGGNHQENRQWMKEFDKLTFKYNSSDSGFTLKGINPFERNINENDGLAIVQRDIKILQDERLTHVILKSSAPGALLSTGTSFECLISIFLSKPVIVIGSPETNKLHPGKFTIIDSWYHPFVEYFADIIVGDINEAIRWICADIAKPKERKNLCHIITKINKNYQIGAEDIDPFK